MGLIEKFADGFVNHADIGHLTLIIVLFGGYRLFKQVREDCKQERETLTTQLVSLMKEDMVWKQENVKAQEGTRLAVENLARLRS